MLRPIDIAPGVQAFATRTPTLPPATHTNSYALGSRDVMLVEPATPYADEQESWIEWARGLRASGRTLVAIFLTHHHPDHVGGSEIFARELGLPVWAHRMTADRVPHLRVERWLDDGETVVLDGPAPQRWNVLHTPGHAPGHLCLHEPALGYLVAGDMVASVGTILIEPTDGDMSAYLLSLERLRRLGARSALPAHGAPIEDPDALLERYLAHRRMRETKIVHALDQCGRAGATAEDLVPAVYDDTPSALWGLARLSVDAHLVKLVREGLVSAKGLRYCTSPAGHPMDPG